MNYKEKWLELLSSDKDIIKHNFQLLKDNKCKDWLDVNINETYILIDGFGSLFKDGRNQGYFCRNSLISFKDFKDCERIDASIEGVQFKVTQDASFGNNVSKSMSFNHKANGSILRSCFPFMISLDQAINLLEDKK